MTPSTMRAAVTQFVLALLAAVAGLAFAPAFGGELRTDDLAPNLLLAAVVTGAAVPAVVVTVARRIDSEALTAAAAGLVAVLVAVLAVCRPGGDVLAGPYRLLTSALPVDPTGPGTAAVGILVGFTALIAALAASYARLRSLAVVPSLVCLLAAVALDAGIAQPPAWFAAVVLVLIGVALALLRTPVHHERPTGARRVAESLPVRVARRGFPLVGAVAILAVSAVLATSFADDLPAVDDRPADARNLVDAPLAPRNAVNPMLQYPAFARGVENLRLTGTSSRRLDQLTLVTLPDFDGQTWTSDAKFRRAGRTLDTGAPTPRISVDITAQDASALSWLVRPDRPASVDQDDLGIDESTGDLVVPGGVGYPERYRVTGGLPVTPGPALESDHATARRGPVSTGSTPVPQSVTRFAKRSDLRSDYVKLAGLQNLLRTGDFYVDDTRNAPSGSGWFQIQALLEAKGKHLGTSEQYASAFATMARVLGFQSRLVLGFEPRYGRSGNRFTITGADVRAWPQVRFARAGWVTFDPTPARPASSAPSRPDPVGAGGTPTPSSSAPSSSIPPPPTSTPPPARSAAKQSTGTGLAVVLVALLIVLVLATPPTVKAGRRRRRRGAGVPAHAIYGAWRETADRLAEIGRPTQRGRTTSEVATSAPRPARDDVRALGRLLDRAGYAPEDAGPDDARTAWTHADAAGGRIRATLPWWRRVLAVLDPRPLWRR